MRTNEDDDGSVWVVSLEATCILTRALRGGENLSNLPCSFALERTPSPVVYSHTSSNAENSGTDVNPLMWMLDTSKLLPRYLLLRKL